LNGIVFIDDVQVCQLRAEMLYGSQELIDVSAYRAGYTLDEARRLDDKTNRGSA